MKDATFNGNKVVLEAKKDTIGLGQKWIKEVSDGPEWYKFKNPISGRYLTAESSSSTSITGKLPYV